MAEKERGLEVKSVQKMPKGFTWDDVKGITRVVDESKVNLLSRVGTINREIEKLEKEMEPLRAKLEELQALEDSFTIQAQQAIMDVMNQCADRQKVLEDMRHVLFKVVGAGNETVAAIVNELQTKPGKLNADKKLNKALEVLAGFPEVEAKVNAALDEMVKTYAKQEETTTEVVALVSKDWAKKTKGQMDKEDAVAKEKAEKEAEGKKHDYEESAGIVPFLAKTGLMNSEHTKQLSEGVWENIVQKFTRIKESVAKSIKGMLSATTAVQDYVSALEDAAKGMLAEGDEGTVLAEDNADFDKMVLDLAQAITNKTDEALDGDDVQRLALMFWVELDFNQGNLTDKEYEQRMAKAKQGLPFGPTRSTSK